ncbi:hypothetical protein Tco_0133815 [Tanacetum coccineum]
MVIDNAFKECDKVKEFELITSSEVDNGIKNIKERSSLSTSTFANEDNNNNGFLVCDPLFEKKKTRLWWWDIQKENCEVNDNKRIVIMDEGDPLVKTTSPLNLREMIDGFDNKLDEVSVTVTECDKVKEFELINSSEVDNGIKNIKERSSLSTSTFANEDNKLNDQGEVNDNKRIVIMDEGDPLVKTTSPLNLSEMIDGFDNKLDEVSVTVTGEVNDNKRIVIMDEGDPLVKTTSPLNLREMIDGFDNKLDEVSVTVTGQDHVKGMDCYGSYWEVISQQ